MIHQVFANRTNVGDWLSARGIKTLLGRETDEHLCDAPFVADTLRRLEGLAATDLIVVGGGGLLMDYFVPFWEGLLARAAHVPFCVWGAGVCAMKNEPTVPAADLLARIGSASKLTVVRDRLTADLLGGAVDVVPCPTLAAVAESRASGHGVLHVDHLDNVGQVVWDAMEEAARAFADATGRPFGRTNNLIESGSEGALARILALYEASDVVVTSRLHGCILAMATGRRFVAVSADHKVEAFLEAAGLREWVLDVADVGRLPAALARVGEQRAPRGFVAAARAAHAAVAARVRRLAG